MFFKGTEKRPAGQMDLEIKGLGGYNNAATSYDYTHYYVVLPSEHYLKALDILSDAVLNSTFPPEEIEREREVVLREIDRKEDSPWGKLFTEFLERTFADNPYGRPILGTAESLAPIDHDAFKRYVGRAYRPSNLVVAIVGDVDAEKAMESVREIFGEIPGEKHTATAPFDIQVPSRPITFTIEKDVQGTYVVVGYPTRWTSPPRSWARGAVRGSIRY
jgi:zinc protease